MKLNELNLCFLKVLVIWFSRFHFLSAQGDILLSQDKVVQVYLQPGINKFYHNGDARVNNIRYVSVEVHAQKVNISLSDDVDFPYESTAKGRDVGILSKFIGNGETMYWYMKTDVEFTTNIKALILLRYITTLEPIPGGCNQIFNLENDPNLLLNYNNYQTNVRFQWSNTDTQNSCDSTVDQNMLMYHVYVYFMKEAELDEESYLEAMKNMMGVTNIMKNGRKITRLYNDMRSISNISVSSVNGQGAIYGIIVTQSDTTSSSYISIASYGCDITNHACNNQLNTPSYIIGVLSGIIGLGLCFFGHKFLKTEFFIMGFLIFCIVSFILVSKYASDVTGVLYGISAILGILGGIILVMFWWCIGIPVLSILIVGLLGGYLFASILYFTPFGNLDIWQTELNYWLSFLCALLMYPLVMLCYPKTLNIISCSFIGSFLVIIFIDILLHTSLKQIILNIFNHAIIDGYTKVLVAVPVQLNDIILYCTWLVLWISGAAFQFERSSGQPPFPPCPRVTRNLRREQERTRNRVLQQCEENEPLISDPPPSYASIQREMQQPT